jgi:hypothetical protein
LHSNLHRNQQPSQAYGEVTLALRKAKVPAELHVYEKGQHGLGLGTGRDLTFASWPERCAAWMRERGLLRKN